MSTTTNEHFAYLDALRESGVTNMFGARPYLETEFGLSRNEAKLILTEWMQTFSERHPTEAKAMTDRIITLADMDAWDAFAADNRDALVNEYGSTANAYQHAVQGGLTLGGGAAPLVNIVFDDDYEDDPLGAWHGRNE